MLRKKYLPYLILLLIILIGGYLRMYRIYDYMGFLGDEGRDVLIVKRIIVDHKFTLLGPITSVGLMHLGPIYYYFMVPFLWLWGLNPVGPAVMVALFSLAAIVLIWQTCREFFNEKAGLIASVLYAVSSLVITYSHSSWNPNLLPFWSLLAIYCLLKVVVKSDYKWMFVWGLTVGIVLQLHYIGLVLLPVAIVSLALLKYRIPIKYYLTSIGGFLLTYWPYIFFEIRHDFINTKTIIEFVTRGGANQASTFTITNFFVKFWDLLVRLFWRLIITQSAELATIVLLGLLGGLGILVIKNKRNSWGKALLVLVIWLFIGLGVLSLYTGVVYDYYLMFAFPLPFLIFGVVVSHFAKTNLNKIISVIFIAIIIYFQIQQTPISKPPNRLAAQAKEIADFILKQADNQSYNFALIAGKNSDHAYRYFLEVDGMAPVVIEDPNVDPERKTVMPQLFIVCEEKICQPLGHPLWEIAGFGRAEITNEWSVGLFKVFKLVHYQGT